LRGQSLRGRGSLVPLAAPLAGGVAVGDAAIEVLARLASLQWKRGRITTRSRIWPIARAAWKKEKQLRDQSMKH